MDLTRDIIYRGFTLNDEGIQDAYVGGGGTGAGITGCILDSADFSDVDIVQFMEKRSLSDGMDVGDVYKGVRRLRLAGTLYATSRALLYDKLFELRAALDPVLAQRVEPADKGYQPLYFSVPTNRVADYPSGLIDLRLLAMPRAFQAVIQRDMQGGDDDDSLAVPWQATLLCRDPSIQGELPQDFEFTDNSVVDSATGTAATDLVTKTAHGLVAGDRLRFTTLTGGTGLSTGTTYYVLASGLTADAFKVSLTAGGAVVGINTDYSLIRYIKAFTDSGTFVNRGNYLGVLNMLLTVGQEASVVSVVAGDSVFTLTIPFSASTSRIVRVKGDQKIVTIEEDGSVEVTAMDVITFDGSSTWPLIPEGETAFTVTFVGTNVGAGSHMWYWETYA